MTAKRFSLDQLQSLMPSPKQRTHPKLSFLPLFFRQRASSIDSHSFPTEVAPGILSTDATAKVFGLYEKNELGQKQQSKYFGPRKSNEHRQYRLKALPRRNSNERSRLRTRGKLEPSAKVRNFSTTQGKSRICGQESQVISIEKSPKYQSKRQLRVQSHQTSQRVKDSEDYITIKYPNPSTGLMTPSIKTDSGGETKATPDSKGVLLTRMPTQKHSSKRWRRDSHSWYNEEPTMLSSISQSQGTTPKRSVSIDVNGESDRFIIKMPTAREPAPYEYPGRTGSQIEEWKNAKRKKWFFLGRQNRYACISDQGY